MKKCEHDIAFEFDYGIAQNLTEKDLWEKIFDKLEFDYNNGKLNFNRKNYIPTDVDGFYVLNFFNFCPWCGQKLDEKTITKRLNEKAQEYVRNIDREKYKLQLVASTKKERNKQIQEKQPCLEIGCVYLIKMGDSYKIGISKNPSQRFKEFTKLPYPIEEIFIEKVNAYEIVEKELHAIFANKQKRGEWFDLNETDIEFIRNYLTERKV